MVIKAILDEEIDMNGKAVKMEEDGTEDHIILNCRWDSLITLREKLKILKEFQ